jgi:hypothetical protein
MKITFEHLKRCNEEDDDFLIEYFNSFRGNDIYEKFLEIIKSWEKYVSYTINFKNDDKNIKISLDFLINELKDYSKEKIVFYHNNMTAFLDVPTRFSKNMSIYSVSDFIYELNYGNLKIDFSSLDSATKNDILQKIPAEFYNKLMAHVANTKSKTITINHPAMKNLEFNFLDSYPYHILKNLFTSYDMDYFRDIIYNLSKKIDGNLLLNSTIFDIEYYIEKIKNENAENLIPNLS